MKKLALIFSFLLFSAMTAFAQQADSTLMAEGKSPEERAEHATQRMKKKLALSNDQASKIMDINLKRAKEVDVIRAKKAQGDKKGAMQELKALSDATDSDYKTILNPEQFSKWLQIKEQKKAKVMEKRKQKKSNK